MKMQRVWGSVCCRETVYNGKVMSVHPANKKMNVTLLTENPAPVHEGAELICQLKSIELGRRLTFRMQDGNSGSSFESFLQKTFS